MKKQIQAAMAAMLVFGTLSLHAQSSTPAPSKTSATAKKAKVKKETEEQRALRELEEKVAAQQEQIDALTRQNAAKDAALSERAVDRDHSADAGSPGLAAGTERGAAGAERGSGHTVAGRRGEWPEEHGDRSAER